MQDPQSLAVAWRLHSRSQRVLMAPWLPDHNCTALQQSLHDALQRFKVQANVNQDLQASGQVLCELQLLLSLIIVDCGFATSFHKLFDEVRFALYLASKAMQI